ncbi:hypothetical protein PV326_009423, partial [Microctonus aethiopoides]
SSHQSKWYKVKWTEQRVLIYPMRNIKVELNKSKSAPPESFSQFCLPLSHEQNVSTPPSTIPSPTTTELSRKAWDVLTEINNSIDGNPSSLTFQNGKGSKI